MRSRESIGVHWGTFIGDYEEAYEAIKELKEGREKLGVVGLEGEAVDGRGRMGVMGIGERRLVALL